MLILGLVAPCQAGDWPGWRGPEREGRSASSQAPVQWSARANVAWDMAVPGGGYSSPVLAGDAVFLSYARHVQPPAGLSNVAVYVVVVWLGLVVALVGLWGAGRCRRVRSGAAWRVCLEGASVTALVPAAGMVVMCGEAVLAFQRAPERAWIAAAFVGTLVLAAAAVAGRGAGLGRVPSICLLLSALALAGTAPEAGQTLASGLGSPRAAVLAVVVAVPLLLGLAVLPPGLGRRRVVAVAARFVGAAAGLGLVLSVLAILRAEQGHVVCVAELHSPGVPWLPLAGLPVLVGAALALVRVTPLRVAARLLAVWAGAAWAVTVLVTVLGRVACAWPYLAYQLGSLELRPGLGRGAVIALLAGLAADLTVLTLVVRRRPPFNPSPWQSVLPLAALSLCLAYLGTVRYLPRWPVFVRGLVCLDWEMGVERWRTEGLEGPQGVMHSQNSVATPTPVTDGQRVVAYFGSAGTLCTDREGRRLWVSRAAPFQSREGVASSPVLCDGRVVLLAESGLGGLLVALDICSGRTLWSTERGKPIHPYAGNCRTPSVLTVGGRKTVVVWGLEDLSGYDPETGHELWSHRLGSFGDGGNPVACPVTDGQRPYLLGTRRSVALRMDGLGGSQNPVVWDHPALDGAECASPVICRGLLFAVADSGYAYCLDPATGATLWREGLGGQCYCSPVAVGDRVYFTSTAGVTTVVAATRQFRVLARNRLGDDVVVTEASPTPVDGRLYLRTGGRLVCLAERGEGGRAPRPEAQSNAPAPAGASRGRAQALDLVSGSWAQFRGPSGTGACAADDYPTTWDGKTGQGLLWTSSELIPGKSSPVVCGRKVIVTGADRDRRVVYCFGAESGKTLWEREVGETPASGERDTTVGHAAPGPATDGERVYARFVDGTLVALDMRGRQVWAQRADLVANTYGHASSLVVWRGRLLLQLDQEPDPGPRSVLAALDGAKGRVLWQTRWGVGSSWSTPVVLRAAGREEVITCASPWVVAYAPETGQALWWAKCLDGEVVPPATVDGGLVVVAKQGALAWRSARVAAAT